MNAIVVRHIAIVPQAATTPGDQRMTNEVLPRLFLRTCATDGSPLGIHSNKALRWPLQPGSIHEAPDFDPRPECGQGLHGIELGVDDGQSLIDPTGDVFWVLFEAEDVVRLDLKIKCRKAKILASGTRQEISALLNDRGIVCPYALILTDKKLRATGGYGSTLTGGDRSTLAGGDRSTLAGGDDSTLTGGYGSKLTGGDRSTLTGGYGSTLAGGNGSTLRCVYWDARRRMVEAFVGEDGIEANVAYRVDDQGKWVKV